ncbi:hypothetical protein NDU88_000808 [Pleurodeles waltl]|uniref:Uncharacterized protein n=1 Tax=Pleurodeles waltl TaxID=8319 RepID=A0AAV7WGJ5_PLEWA|nr:hypothetical protein NDU88_000808 [Pleurodeles waltl]
MAGMPPQDAESPWTRLEWFCTKPSGEPKVTRSSAALPPLPKPLVRRVRPSRDAVEKVVAKTWSSINVVPLHEEEEVCTLARSSARVEQHYAQSDTRGAASTWYQHVRKKESEHWHAVRCMWNSINVQWYQRVRKKESEHWRAVRRMWNSINAQWYQHVSKKESEHWRGVRCMWNSINAQWYQHMRKKESEHWRGVRCMWNSINAQWYQHVRKKKSAHWRAVRHVWNSINAQSDTRGAASTWYQHVRKKESENWRAVRCMWNSINVQW